MQFLGACIAEDNLMLVLEYMAGAFLYSQKWKPSQRASTRSLHKHDGHWCAQ